MHKGLFSLFEAFGRPFAAFGFPFKDYEWTFKGFRIPIQ